MGIVPSPNHRSSDVSKVLWDLTRFEGRPVNWRLDTAGVPSRMYIQDVIVKRNVLGLISASGWIHLNDLSTACRMRRHLNTKPHGLITHLKPRHLVTMDLQEVDHQETPGTPGYYVWWK